jgi:hypothetical protein
VPRSAALPGGKGQSHDAVGFDQILDFEQPSHHVCNIIKVPTCLRHFQSATLLTVFFILYFYKSQQHTRRAVDCLQCVIITAVRRRRTIDAADSKKIAGLRAILAANNLQGWHPKRHRHGARTQSLRALQVMRVCNRVVLLLQCVCDARGCRRSFHQ